MFETRGSISVSSCVFVVPASQLATSNSHELTRNHTKTKHEWQRFREHDLTSYDSDQFPQVGTLNTNQQIETTKHTKNTKAFEIAEWMMMANATPWARDPFR
jgi:hypothetical protein